MTSEAALENSPQQIFLNPLDEGALLNHLINTNGRGIPDQKEPTLTVLASLLPPTETKTQ